MPLTSFQVFNAYTNLAIQEVLSYQTDLFNAATKGGIVLTNKRNEGDFSDSTIWQRIPGLVRKRNVYGAGALTELNMVQLLETSVKVADGTPPVRVDAAWFEWVLKNPEEGGAIYGKQLGEDKLAEMINTALGAYRAAITTQALVVNDITGSANASLNALLNTAAKMGDRSGAISCWVGHSKPLFDIWGSAITNGNQLFSFNNVRIVEDGFGRTFVMTDAPPLTEANGVSVGVPAYYMHGLTAGAVVVEENGDFNQHTDTRNGFENIATTIQSEWSYNLSVKGFAWDKANGGKSPSSAALMTGTNWDRIATSHKDLAGVMLRSR